MATPKTKPSPAKRPASKKPAEPAPRPSRKAKATKPKLGRPPKKPSEKRSAWLRIRLTLDTKRELQALADAADMSLTDYVLARSLNRIPEKA